jgi:hypothetical protein
MTEQRFYPVRVDPRPISVCDPRECFPSDLGAGFFEDNFSDIQLKLREHAYTSSLLASA